MFANSDDTLWTVAKKSLEQNTVYSNEGPITVAGGTHFRTFWVRDFAYAVPGLLALGHYEQVKGQIEITIKHQSPEGLIARGFDVINPKLRVTAGSFKVQKLVGGDYANKPLKAEYLGEHGTPSVDSNLLILLICSQWTEKTGNSYFWINYDEALRKAFENVLLLKGEQLLAQPAYSDWQDSARREGYTFYLNLLFCRVLARLQKLGIEWAQKENLAEWKNHLWEHFYDKKPGLFRSQTDREQYSLETQLWCIEEDIFADYISRSQLWANLITSPLWNPLPGRPVYPDYSSEDISWTTKVVGLRHYHDQFYWSWLLAESLRVAAFMESEPQTLKIRQELDRLAANHGTIHEIYEMRQLLVPVSRPLYKSESPFSWGAGKIIEALDAIAQAKHR